MPTIKQMHEMDIARHTLGLSNEEFYCQDYNPDYKRPQEKDNDGEKIGTVYLTLKDGNEELNVEIDKTEKPSELENISNNELDAPII